MDTLISYDQIASKLIHDKLLLTALELHLELIEGGRELSRLKEYFSNPGNFERQATQPGDRAATSIARSQSQATLDSLDISRFSEDDGDRGAVDERVAVLEFELRKARECITALRANLTEAACTSESEMSEVATVDSNTVLKRHEQRALNFLVNEYLLRQGYRLTAVTFSEENENQDFEDWDDVGLNMPRPPELSRVYRDFARLMSCVPQESQVTQTEWDPTDTSVACQTDDSTELNATDIIFAPKTDDNCMLIELEEAKLALQKQNIELEKEKIELQKRLDAVEEERNRNAILIEEPGSRSSSNGTADQFEMVDHTSGDQDWTKIEERVEESREVPQQFRKELYLLLQMSPFAAVSSCSDVISQLTELLPKILQSLPSNRKEDLIPLIATSARLHRDEEQASKLVALLLSLRKRPQENERRAIIAGLCDLASNSTFIETHLLPQLWDLVGVKVLERRLLAAEACSALSPLTSDLVRKSQLLPLLQTLLIEAVEEEVKTSAVKNLAVLVTYISDCDKYLQCEELCFMALKDQSVAVQTCTIQFLLPVLAQWAFQIKKLQSHLLVRLLSTIKTVTNDPRSIYLINAFINILPYLLLYTGNCEFVKNFSTELCTRNDLSSLFQSLNNPLCFYGDEATSIIYALSSALSEDCKSWNELCWVKSTLVPELYEIACVLTVSNEEIVTAFVKLFHFVCKSFGKKFTQDVIKPLFMNGLKKFEEVATSNLGATEELANVVIIPVLLVAVLTTGDPEDTKELADILKHLLVSIPVCNLPIFPLKMSVPHLCRAAALQETVLGALVDASKHSRSVVRLSAAQLLLPCLPSLVSTDSTSSMLTSTVLSALAMLSNDPDPDVREATVFLFAELIAISNNKEAQMQGRATLQAFLKDCPGNVSHTMSLALTRALGRIVVVCDPAFREDVVVPHLLYLSTHCMHGCSSQTRRIDLGLALIGAISVALQAPLSKQCISTYLVPSLRNLEVITGECLSAHHDAVSCWLREAESRCSVTTPSPTEMRTMSPVTGSQLVQAVSSASAVGRRSVEDVKQKVSNLLRKK